MAAHPTEAFLLDRAPDGRTVRVEVYHDATTTRRQRVTAANKILRAQDHLPNGTWSRECVRSVQIDPGNPDARGVGFHSIFVFTLKRAARR